MSDAASEVPRTIVGIDFRSTSDLMSARTSRHSNPREGEQDECRANGIDVGALAPEKGHGVGTVGRRVQSDGSVCIAKCLLGQPAVARAVFDQKYVRLIHQGSIRQSFGLIPSPPARLPGAI